MVELDVEEYVDYTKYSNRQLMAGPIILLAIALLFIGSWTVVTGAPANMAYEFTGGAEIHVNAPGGESEIRQTFDQPITSIRAIPNTDQYIVTFQVTDENAVRPEEIFDTADAAFGEENVLAKDETNPSFGASTQELALLGVFFAFVGMSIFVFILFRTVVPSAAVVLSAFSDMMIPIAVMNLVGIELSLGTVVALLMIIGYSVDSDILLTNHVLRRSGEFYESTYRAMRTGVTMTLTSMSAVIVMAVVASVFGIELLTAIGTILALGLATDLVNTYLFNVALLRWYRGVEV